MTGFIDILKLSEKKISLLFVLLPFLWLISGFYSVDQNEIALPVVLGTVHDYKSAGIHYNLPLPLGDVFIADIKKSQTVSVGFGNIDYDGMTSNELKGTIIDYTGNSREIVYMDRNVFNQQFMTGDGNILAIEMALIFNISDPMNWFFNYENPFQIITSTAQNVLYEKLSTGTVDSILVRDPLLEFQLRESIQEELNFLECGALISAVILKTVSLPVKNVESAFRDVKSAEDDRTKRIEEAKREASIIVAQGKTEALKISDSAIIIGVDIKNDALSDSEVFTKMLSSKELENEFDFRFLRETMEEVLKAGTTYLIAPQDSLESFYINEKGE
jgi:membrane protease subunit HflK